MTGLVFQLDGLKDTNTEGIHRTQFSYTIQGLEDSRAFFHLLPGRYRVSVGSIDRFGFVDRYYTGEEYFDLSIGEPIYGGFHEVDPTITLEVAPAKVRGRLFAADALGEFELQDSFFNSNRSRKPAYKPKQAEGIYLVEYLTEFTDPGDPASPLVADDPVDLNVDLGDGPYLPPDQRVVSVDTDESGLFSIAVLPGRYGLRIPALNEVEGVDGSGYWGSHVILRDLTTGATSTQDWPLHQEWPSGFTSPTPFPIALQSNHEYELDIFVRKQVVEIRGEVRPIDDPIRRLLANVDDLGTSGNTSGHSGFEDLVDNGGMATLVSPNGTQMEALFIFNDPGQDPDIAYQISNVVAGTHSLSLTHSRFTFEHDGNALPIDIVLHAWKGPGELPTLDPADSSFVEPLTTVIINPDVFGTYTPSNTVIMVRRFDVDPNPGPEDPEYIESSVIGDAAFTTIAVQPSYADGKIFVFESIWPVGSFSFWIGRDFDGSVTWFEGSTNGSKTISLHYGGSSNSFTDPQPFNTVRAHYKSINFDDPATEITGTAFTLDIDGTPTVFSTPHTQSNIKGSFGFSNVTHPSNWIINSSETRLTNLSGPEFTVTILMKRSFDIAGTVKTGVFPIEGATVEIKGRFNNTLKEFTTGSDGTFAQTMASEIIFVDITAPGYLPWRERYNPAVLTGDPPTLTISANLIPIDPPAFGTITLDRFGLFLPGVNKSGDQDAFYGFNASGPLTLTVEAIATPQNLPISYDLLPFDSANGEAGDSQSVELPDAISEIWIIDPRKFPVNPEQVPPLTGNPFNETPVPISPPSSGRPEDSLKWLQEIESGVIPNVFFQKVTDFTLNGDEATAVATIPLWELPPGDFDPIFVAVTRQGAITIKSDFQYPDPVETHRLEGARMPPWLAFVADTLGTVAGVIRTNNAIADIQNPNLVGQPLDLSSFIPEGRFKPLPEFTADIGLDEDNDGFLLYDYNIAVNVNEGMETPASGMLGLSPGILGLNLLASAGVAVSGHEKSVSLTVQGTATTKEDIDLEEYLPKKLFGFQPEETHLKPAITLRTAATSFLDDNNKLEAQLRHQVIGAMQTGLKFNLQPITSKIPYVGPVLLSLDKAKKFQILGTLDGAISLDSQTTWSTVRPRIFEAESITTDHRFRRHFMGGDENISIPAGEQPQNSNRFELGFNFGAGIEIKTKSALGATGRIALQGEEKVIPGFEDPLPVATVVFNDEADWPYLTRIQGAINLSLEARLDLGITELKKGWDWDLITFEHNFGNVEESGSSAKGLSLGLFGGGGPTASATLPTTPPVFQLVPLTITDAVVELENLSPVDYTGETPQTVLDFLEVGSYAGAPGSVEALVFTDLAVEPDLAAGNMTLKIALRTGENSWGAPVVIADAPGMAEVTITQLSGGQWMAGWVEIAGDDLLDPFGPMSIKTALSSDATAASWLVENFDTVADLTDSRAKDLRFTIGSSLVGLVFLETDGGPASSDFAIRGATWDGNDWSLDETPLLPTTTLSGFEAAGAGVSGSDVAQIVYVNGDQELYAIEWDGSIAGTTDLLSDSATGTLAIAAGEADTFYAAYGLLGGGIGLSKFDSVWSDLGTPSATAIPGEIQVAALDDATDPTVVVLSWISGSGPSTISYAYTDTAGVVEIPETELTGNTVGNYHGLQLIAGDNRDAVLMALFTNNPGADELRVFNLVFDNGVTGNDRDSDGMNDIKELRIVDVDNVDAFVTVDDVLPGDDFDGDRFSNFEEIADGSDPTNPLDIPDIGGVVVETTLPEASEFSLIEGSFTITRPDSDLTQSLTVNMNDSGSSALAGTDFVDFANSVDIPINSLIQTVSVTPMADTEAEGDESVVLNLESSPNYNLGAEDSATVILKDLPADDWRFHNLLNPNSPEAADGADPDNDGISNLLEYALLLGPGVPDTILLPELLLDEDEQGDFHLTLGYTRNINAIDLIYTIEVSEDLQTWTSNTPGQEDVTTEISRIDNFDGTETVTERDNGNLNDSQNRYLRLRVERAASP